MILKIQCLSSLSGKALLLQIEEHRMVFNMFEGFQRFCIEQRVGIGSIRTVFIQEISRIAAFAALYATLGDLHPRSLTVVSDSLVDMGCIHRFITEQPVALRFEERYAGQGMRVDPVVVDGTANYFVHFAPRSGRFHPERVPPGIPKAMYRELAAGGRVVHEGAEYDGAAYCDPPVEIGPMCVLNSYGSFGQLRERLGAMRVFFCMNARALDAALEMRPAGALVYHVENNAFVEYAAAYEIQRGLALADGRYLLPGGAARGGCRTVSDLVHGAPGEAAGGDFIALKNGDVLDFLSREGRFELVPSVLARPVETAHAPAYPSLTFLGTACCIPTKYRNVSAILYESERSAVLLDCGEDTLGQILRLRGSLDVLGKLRVLYLSHSHADHMLGAAAVLAYLEHPVRVVGPLACREFIEGVYRRSGRGVEHEYVPTAEAKALERAFYEEHREYEGVGWLAAAETAGVEWERYVLRVEAGEFELRIVGVQHSADSVSVQLHDRETGRRVAYSGDTSPAALFAAVARGSDLLVHECTFLAGQEANARATRHSTEREAREVFRRSGARELLLTHFSNRNQHLENEPGFAVDFYRHLFGDAH